MTVQSAAPVRRPVIRPWTIPTIFVGAMLLAVLLLQPDFSVLAELSPVIKIHLAGALIALVLGVIMLNSTKGATFHRRLGWVWAGVMMVVAVSSLFITEIFRDVWSPIHILSGLTIVMVPVAIAAARKHNVKAHRRHMTTMFWFALVTAGLFAFIPGRVMWRMFF